MLQKVYENALPRLIGKKVRDFCIGKKLVAVELDDGGIGVAYNLNEIGVSSVSAGMEKSSVGMHRRSHRFAER